MKSQAYLNEIRQIAGLKRAVLKKITVEGKTVTFHLVTDVTYTQEDIRRAQETCARYAPAGFTAQASVVKSVPSAEAIRAAIAEILKRKYPAAAAFLSPADIEVETDATGGRFCVLAGEAERAQLTGVLDSIAEELGRSFCGSFVGGFRAVEREMGEIVSEELPPAEEVRAPRVFPIMDYSPIDGANPTLALLIADLTGEKQGITVCGVVSHIEERMTKKEKPFFLITLSDGSGRLRASYFAKQRTLEKVRTVKAGDSVCLTGNYELFNGNLSFTARSIDYGSAPENFEIAAQPSRPVPARYSVVFPEPASDLVQADLFGRDPLPAALTEGRFVVFDLETTGLNHTGVGGTMDRIIEVGAVKIVNGEICERFSTFVACPVRLSREIVALTGIDDGMLVGAPDIKDVIADFYKFCDDCVLVGHNVTFDASFVRYYGEKEGYLFSHRQYDTVTFSQELLTLSNYKLNTVADYFGFHFNHHRAYDDAFVTAKIFLELARRKGGLPRR